MLGNQSMYQKFFSAKSEKDASRAVVGWIVGTVILETVIVALAVTGSALFPTGEVHDHPREILAYIGLHGFEPAPVTTVVIEPPAPSTVITTTAPRPHHPLPLTCSNSSARSSSAPSSPRSSPPPTTISSPPPPTSSTTSSSATSAPRPPTSKSSSSAASWSSCSASGRSIQSLGTESVLKKALYAYTIYSAALTPVILAAFFWRRATASAAVASISTGTFVTVFWDTAFIHPHLPQVIADRDAIFPALIASLLCLLVVSLLTPPPSPQQLQPFAEV